MAGKTSFSIAILADAKQAKQGFGEAETGLDKLESKAGKASAALGVASAGVIALGKEAFDSASALQQSTGAVESVFSAQAEEVKKLADVAADTVGLSKNQYNELASVLGSQLKNLGTSQDELAGKSDELITLGADLAATFGGTTADAVGALSSLMRGERDPIERYGVSIKAADIEARLAAEGLSGLEGEARTAAETQAMMGILMEQTAAATGAFARESDTAAGSQQSAAAAYENAKAALGEVLLPYVAQAADKLGEMAKWAAEHPALFQVMASAILGLTGALAGIVGGIRAWKAATDAVKTAQELLNGTMKLNPMMAAVAAIAALVAALIWAYNNVEWFRDGVNAAADWIGQKFQEVIAAVKDVGQWFSTLPEKTGAAIETAKQVVGNFVDSVAEKFGQAIEWIRSLGDRAAAIGDFFGNGIRAAIQWIVDFVDKIVTAYFDRVKQNIEIMGNIAATIGDFFGAGIDIARQWIASLTDWVAEKFNIVIGWINDVVDFAAGIGDAFGNTVDRAIGYVRDLIDWIRTAWDWLTSFGNASDQAGAMGYYAAGPADILGIPSGNVGMIYGIPTPSITAASVPRVNGIVRATTTSQANQPAAINITVTGALDPDGVARQIKQLLARYDRRQSW
ncbi:hypothetical protein ACL1A3_10280 [Corynebacterium striatum]